MLCAQCGVPFQPPPRKPGPGRNRTRCDDCRPGARRSPERTRCVICQANLPPGRRKFCSQACDNREWMQLYRSDAVFREKARARQRKSPLRQLTCLHCASEFEGYHARAYCSPACKRAARNLRRSKEPRRDAVVGSVAWLHGVYAPKAKMVRVTPTGPGVVAWCPACSSAMCARSTGKRACVMCATELELNREEVDAICAGWLEAV